MTKFDKWSIRETLRSNGSFHRKYTERKVSGKFFDESIANHQNSSDFSPVKVLHYTTLSF